jgi:hypothetical protein
MYVAEQTNNPPDNNLEFRPRYALSTVSDNLGRTKPINANDNFMLRS